MKNEVTDQLKALLIVHGADFWASVFSLTTQIGLCECGRPGRLVNFGPMHFGACDPCRKQWWLGDDHFEWKHETPQQWSENLEYIKHYELIQPRFPNMIGPGGELATLDQIDRYRDALIDLGLNEAEPRRRIIDRIAEIEIDSLKEV